MLHKRACVVGRRLTMCRRRRLISEDDGDVGSWSEVQCVSGLCRSSCASEDRQFSPAFFQLTAESDLKIRFSLDSEAAQSLTHVSKNSKPFLIHSPGTLGQAQRCPSCFGIALPWLLSGMKMAARDRRASSVLARFMPFYRDLEF